MPVVTLPEGKTVGALGVRAELAAVDERLRKALPAALIASFASTGDHAFVADDGRTIFSLAYPRPKPSSRQSGEAPKAAKAAVRALEGYGVGGAPVLGSSVSMAPSRKAAGRCQPQGWSRGLEALIGGFGALLVLVLRLRLSASCSCRC